MGVCVALLLATVVCVTHAGRLPYLGGDIDEILAQSKHPDLTDPAAAWIVSNKVPVEPKPITQKQKRDSTNYNSKFTDIARAYAEGYKAAIKAVQQRAIIAKRRLQSLKPNPLPYQYRPNYARSIIPQPPSLPSLNLPPPAPLVPKSTIPLPAVPEEIPGVGESKEVISPGPVSEHETQTLPTLNDLPDNKAGKEELVARSNIPTPPTVQDVAVPHEEKKSVISGDATPNMFAAAVRAQMTENAVEKSWIPGVASSASDSPLNMNERSTHFEMPKYMQEDHPAFSKVSVHMRSQEKRDKIAKMNARARHRNIYFDGAGGDPFNGGGVLSVQNAVSLTEKHRRRRRNSEDEYYLVPSHERIIRSRRSHMPYLGQNLDAMGVVRATPKSWTSAQVRKSLEFSKSKPNIAVQTSAYNSPEMSASPFTQAMPATFRADIPQPPMGMMGQPMAMNYGQMFNPGQQAQFAAYRSMIPGYPSFYNQIPGPYGFPFQSPLPAGVISEEVPSVESSISAPEEIREKKSTIPTPPEEQDHQNFETVTFNA